MKILIVDDHEAAAKGLEYLLSCDEIAITTISETGQIVDAIKTHETDVVLLDVRMPDSDGLTTLSKIRDEFPELPVVMMSAHDNPTYVARAAAMGASDFLMKSDSRERMSEALRDAHLGSDPNPSGLLSKTKSVMHRDASTVSLPSNMPLTKREIQVLMHIALGLSNKEIASSLKISVETVKEHVQNILRKIGANDRTDAAVRAVRAGIVH